MSWVELLQGGTKRTLSDVLRKLPRHGVGSLVTRDTWHPAASKYWEVVEVVPQPDDPSKFSVWGVKYFKGERVNETPKRIASVWKHGWTLRPPTSAGELYKQLTERRAAAAAAGLLPPPGDSDQPHAPGS